MCVLRSLELRLVRVSFDGRRFVDANIYKGEGVDRREEGIK